MRQSEKKNWRKKGKGLLNKYIKFHTEKNWRKKEKGMLNRY